ncbi:peroxisomal assembly protein, partial [Coemansia sp. RSA 451]
LYASVIGQGASQGPCVVRIVKDSACDTRSNDDRPVCVASSAVWSTICSNSARQNGDDALVIAKIEAIIPVELKEIVLGVSSEHYANAQAQQTAIVSQFRAHGEVLYPGLSVTIPGDSEAGVVSPIALECLMCQPTTQGVFARDSDPRIVVVKNPAQSSALAHSNSHNGSELDDLQETDDSDLEQWDIGAEWFILGGSALESGRGKLVDAAFNQPWLSSAMHSSVLDETTAALNGRYVNLTAIAFEAPLDGVQLVPKEFPGEDLANRGFMSLASLAKAGIVSGTWALVALDYASKDNQQLGAEQRAIRIFGLDKGAPPTGSLALPPILLHNICSTRKESGTKALGNYSAEIKVLLTPLGLPPSTPSSTYLKSVTKLPTTNGAAYQPPLHIAKKVVISRVSSPLSERRDLESIAFAALRKWLIPLETSQGIRPLRVVKTGDLIAVRIHLAEAAVRTSVALVAGTDAANRVRNNDSIMDPSFVDVDPASDLALDYPIVQESAHGAVASELVFFKVMHAEGFRDKHGTNRLQAVPSLDDDEDSDSDSDDDQSFVEDADSFDLCELDDDLDELDKEWTRWHWQTKSAGFIIEPDITNVVQSGAEHSFVPYLSAAAYIEAGEFFSGTGRDCSSAVPYADAFNQILRLAKTSSHPLALSRNLFCSLLLKGNPGTGKRTLVREVAKQLGVHLYELSCYDILSDTEDKTAQVLQMYFQNARRYTPCILHLRSVDALSQASNAPPGQDTPDDLPIARVLRSCISSIGQAHRETGFPIIVIATSNQPDKIPTALATAFRHEVELSVPDENTRLALLERIAAKSMPLAADTDLAYTAQQTASFVARDLAMLVKRAENRAWRRSQQNLSLQKSVCQPLRTRDALLSGLVITNEDLLGALGDARASMSDTLGQGDSGGVMDRIVSQLLAELDGMSGGGDSSDNGDDSQGADSKSKEGGAGASAVQVFAIGATNRPDLLDPALLRPGRFDKLVYLGVSETHDAQLNIIQALTRKFHLHPDLDLRDIAEKCPFHYTGADFYALCSDSLLKAMLRTVDEVDILVEKWNYSRGQLVPGSTDASDKTQTHYPVPMTPQYYLDHVADDTIKQVTVTTNDFERALDELIPSVSAEELVRYQSLRRQFDSTQKRQEQGPLHQNDELSTELLPSDVLENIQQSMHAQQETSQEITFGKDVDQTTDTKASTKQRCRKGKEREV